MTTPIYKSEQAWRGHMLVSQRTVSRASAGVSKTIISMFIAYLISTWSVPAALAWAVADLCVCLWWDRRTGKSIGKLLAFMNSDPDLDIAGGDW